MGRGRRNNTSSWTEDHPDQKIWTPEQACLAQSMSQEAYEALYGRGSAAEPQNEAEWLALRRSREEYFERWQSETAEEWMSVWGLRGPFDEEGLLAEWQRRVRDSSIPASGATVLAAALDTQEGISVLSGALRSSRRRDLTSPQPWRRVFSSGDKYLFDKLLPALYSSRSLEAFLGRNRGPEALLEMIATAERIEKRWGSWVEHSEDLLGEIDAGNPQLADIITKTVGDWNGRLGEIIARDGGDRGYTALWDIRPGEEIAGAEAAAHLSLSCLLSTQIVFALARNHEAQRQHEEGGGHLWRVLEKSWRDGLSPQEMISGSGLFSLEQSQLLASGVEQRLEEINESWPSDPSMQSYELLESCFCGAIYEASGEFVSRYRESPHPSIGAILYDKLQRVFVF